MLDILNTATALLTGSLPNEINFDPALQRHSERLNNAVVELRRRGHSVTPADGVPGLWSVSGMPELTSGQLIDAAFQTPSGTGYDSPPA